MPQDASIRILSLLVVAVVACCFHSEVVVNFTASFGLTHFLLSYVYSRRQISEIFQAPVWPLRISLLLPLLAGLFTFKVPLLTYFGMHHIFNELYLPVQRKAMPPSILFRVSRLAFHLCCYLFIVRNHPVMSGVGTELLTVLTVTAASVYGICLLKEKAQLTDGRLKSLASIDAITITTVLVSLFVAINLYHIALYHFVLWFFFPLTQLLKQSRIQALIYVIYNVVLTAAALDISPLGFHSMFAWKEWKALFAGATYIHISTALVLSDAHPRWIVNLFRPTAGRLPVNSVANSLPRSEIERSLVLR